MTTFVYFIDDKLYLFYGNSPSMLHPFCDEDRYSSHMILQIVIQINFLFEFG